MTAFHEVLFPLDISLKSAGGPQRRTDVVLLGSGAEERNARWTHSRRRYDAGYGVKTFEALSQVLVFFEDGFTVFAGATGLTIPQPLRGMRLHRPTRSSAQETASPRRSSSARSMVRFMHRTAGRL
jgi:hypothetical protein